MKIIDTTFNFVNGLTKRSTTKYIIIHHRAGNGDVQSIHQGHLGNGWSGIGYHFYVRKDGKVYSGRPINTSGAHTTNYNSVSVGVCFEGNFDQETKMSDAQLKSGQELIAYIKGKYPNAKVKKHKDFNATACPGKNFPFNDIVYGETKKQIQQKELITANDIIWELMNGKYKIKISEVDRAVKALDKAKNSEEFLSLYWILYKLVNGNG